MFRLCVSLRTEGSGVQSPVRELRFHKPHGMTQKKKKIKYISNQKFS